MMKEVKAEKKAKSRISFITLSDAATKAGPGEGFIASYALAACYVYENYKVLTSFEKKGELIFIVEK